MPFCKLAIRVYRQLAKLPQPGRASRRILRLGAQQHPVDRRRLRGDR